MLQKEGVLDKSKGFTADAVANEFLKGRLGEISPMKLQKLVYYAHAWSWALFDEPLVSDRIEAWEYGPVIPALYGEFREFGNGNITRLATEYRHKKNGAPTEEPELLPEDATRAKTLIARIWDLLGDMTAIQLSNMSHGPDEPWSQIPKKRPGLSIPDELIKSCFKDILAKSTAKTA